MWPGAELNPFLFFSVTALAVAEHLPMVWFRQTWTTQRLTQLLPAQSSGKCRGKSFFPLVKWQRHSTTYHSLNCLTPKSLTMKYRLSMKYSVHIGTISGEPLCFQEFFLKYNSCLVTTPVSVPKGQTKLGQKLCPRTAQLLRPCSRTDIKTQ